MVADCDMSWIIDFGASFHATLCQYFFATYEPNFGHGEDDK